MQPVQLEKQQDFERARRAIALSNIENGDDVVSDDGGNRRRRGCRADVTSSEDQCDNARDSASD